MKNKKYFLNEGLFDIPKYVPENWEPLTLEEYHSFKDVINSAKSKGKGNWQAFKLELFDDDNYFITDKDWFKNSNFKYTDSKTGKTFYQIMCNLKDFYFTTQGWYEWELPDSEDEYGIDDVRDYFDYYGLNIDYNRNIKDNINIPQFLKNNFVLHDIEYVIEDDNCSDTTKIEGYNERERKRVDNTVDTDWGTFGEIDIECAGNLDISVGEMAVYVLLEKRN